MQRSGFSLVELSIVLVILGLLTGAVLTGQNLIRAAELRSVTTEFQSHQTAILTFRDKYFALPGDMTNATDFWGQATNCGTQGVELNGACNGDGDGIIGWTQTNANFLEQFYAWHQLGKSGLIEGSYSGTSGVGHVYDDANAGVNVPRSKLESNVGWCFNKAGYGLGFFLWDVGQGTSGYGASLTIGSTSSPVASACASDSSGGHALGHSFTPEEAWNIDKKVDDGIPGRGKVLGNNPYSCSTMTTNVGTAATQDFDAAYDLTAMTKNCYISFIKAW